MTTNNIALEHLNTLAIAFLDAIVNLHRIANVKACNLRIDLLLLDCADDIHVKFLLYFHYFIYKHKVMSETQLIIIR